MHADAIVIATDALRTLQDRMQRAEQQLTALSSPPRFALTPTVESAYTDLADRWERSRVELSEELGTLATVLAGIADAFEACDAELAGTLAAPAVTGGGGGGR